MIAIVFKLNPSLEPMYDLPNFAPWRTGLLYVVYHINILCLQYVKDSDSSDPPRFAEFWNGYFTWSAVCFYVFSCNC